MESYDFYDRVYLSGFKDLKSTRDKYHRAIWTAILIALYSSVAYQTYTTLKAYSLVDTIIVAERVLQNPDTDTGAIFPQINVCHTGNFNKTYVRESIRIPDETLRRAQTEFDWDEDRVLEEFLRYMNLFSMFVFPGEFSNESWAMMREIYDANFQTVQFADFVSDAALRGDTLFRNCQWGTEKYRCHQILLPIDMVSCWALMVQRSYRQHVDEVGIKRALQFEMHLPTRHISSNWNEDQNYGVDELGVRILYGTEPSPLKVPCTLPGNTHAIIRLRSTTIKLTKGCYMPWETPRLVDTNYYSPDECMKDLFIDLAKEQCKCGILLGDVFPRNGDLCTPVDIRDCVQRKILPMGIHDVANRTMFAYAKSHCKDPCEADRYEPDYSFYQLQSEDESIIRNRFTIFYESTDYTIVYERSVRDDKGMAVYLGGVWIVYTGMSAVAIVHTLSLIVHKVFECLVSPWIKRIKERYQRSGIDEDQVKRVMVARRLEFHQRRSVTVREIETDVV